MDTNWYTITAFRRLASNSSSSILKGQRVIVTGRLRLRDWENGDRKGLAIEVEADALGHDLTWGTAQFHRNTVVSAPSQQAQSPADADADIGTDIGTDADRPGGAVEGGAVDADGWAVPGASLRAQATQQAAQHAESTDTADADDEAATSVGSQEELAEAPF